ncbi:50S ribosomal protein L17 [bacterium]|nr:50S ribosomal protein L17 [bacterium]
MRHKKNRSKLGAPTDQRLALVRNQVAGLFEHGKIDTTLPRAKAVQRLAEKLITMAKRGGLANVRQCARHLPGKKALAALLKKAAPALADVQSGYTRIAKLAYRRGDGALMVRLSLMKYPAGDGKGG